MTLILGAMLVTGANIMKQCMNDKLRVNVKLLVPKSPSGHKLFVISVLSCVTPIEKVNNKDL